MRARKTIKIWPGVLKNLTLFSGFNNRAIEGGDPVLSEHVKGSSLYILLSRDIPT